jgi:hypothetical protein
VTDKIKVVIRSDEWWPIADIDRDTTGYNDGDLMDCLIEVTEAEFREYERLSRDVREMSDDFFSRRKKP